MSGPKRRAHNSTLPAPTKGLKRSSPIGRGKWKRAGSGLWEALDGLPIAKGIVMARGREQERKAAEFARKYGSLERVFIVQTMTCIVPFCGRTPCENAHGDDGKEGAYKAGYLTINPLCAQHHRLHRESFHGLGSESAFEERWLIPNGLTWAECADQTEAIVQRDGPTIMQFARMDGRWDDFNRGF